MGYEFFRYKDARGLWRWRLRSLGNHKIVADSGEGYSSLADCDRAITLVKQVVPPAALT